MEFDSFEKIKWNVIDDKLKQASFVETRQGRKKIKYLDLSLSFDTETTSTYIDNDGKKDKFAFMYVWQFGIDGYYCYGRTWEQFLQLCSYIQKKLDLGLKKTCYYLYS